jgi:hypothetical protein
VVKKKQPLLHGLGSRKQMPILQGRIGNLNRLSLTHIQGINADRKQNNASACYGDKDLGVGARFWCCC